MKYLYYIFYTQFNHFYILYCTRTKAVNTVIIYITYIINSQRTATEALQELQLFFAEDVTFLLTAP